MATAASLIFITGGVRSGKSTFAERLAIGISAQTGGKLHYIATGKPTDSEMEKRIKLHQKDRSKSQYNWKTWEQPVQLSELVRFFCPEDIVLLDCLTILLNNELFNQDGSWEDIEFCEQVKHRILTDIFTLSQSCGSLLVVSNEVLNAPIGDNELVLTYGKILGQVHQQLVKEGDLAYLVQSGIPVLMKGVKG